MSTDTSAQIAELDALPMRDLREHWRGLMGADPPRYNRRFLIRRLAYRLQELAYGGLSQAARARMNELLAQAGCDELGSLRPSTQKARGRREMSIAGTRLIREWNGQRHEVTVVQGGFAYQGRRYRSLTAITQTITGTHWNGPCLLRTSRRRRKRASLMRRPRDPEGAPVPRVRCAIYTRKSTDEGLDSDFNSLDAQREAAEAYILSQRQEGWEALPDRYDDGGFSGGNLERPGLLRLLDGIEAGRIDCVVVYKVDRLSRSLLDFARLIEIFDRRTVSFVSITQRFNTTTSMGRLVLNILLSFAQFEREIIGERIRDKVAATKRKGMYTGGPPVLGYDVDRERKRLVVNPEAAELVRHIFSEFAQSGSTTKLAQELNAEGHTTKSWTTKKGVTRAGKPWNKGYLYRLLNNPLYLGEVSHKDKTLSW